MNTAHNFFALPLPSQNRTLQHDDELCSPWTEEVHDYRKHPLYRPKPERPLPSRRYTSQLEHYRTDKPQPAKDKSKNELTSLLAEKAVTIEYEGDRPSPHPTPKHNPRHRLKLPSLPSTLRSSSPLPSPLPCPPSCTPSTQRSSLKRHTPRHDDHSPPHFQIYKRSLVAARQWLSCGYSAN